MRIELSIDRLVADGRIAGSAEELLAALTGELRLVLARELGQRQMSQLTGDQAISVPRLRAALTLPPAGTGAAGRAIGAALGGAVTGDRVFGGGSNGTGR
jgi:hypothetical protein